MMDKKTMYIIIGTTVLAGGLLYLSIKDVFDIDVLSIVYCDS